MCIRDRTLAGYQLDYFGDTERTVRAWVQDQFGNVYGPIGDSIELALPADDHGSTSDNATPVALVSDTSAVLDFAGDRDWFELTVSNNTKLAIYSSGNTNTEGILFNTSGDQITDDVYSGVGVNFSLSLSLGPGTYYLSLIHI